MSAYWMGVLTVPCVALSLVVLYLLVVTLFARSSSIQIECYMERCEPWQRRPSESRLPWWWFWFAWKRHRWTDPHRTLLAAKRLSNRRPENS